MDQRWYEMTISKFVDQVLSGEKTLLQIERHMAKNGWSQKNIDMTMQHVRDEISRRKKGNG
jgi:hypothetical protein